MFTRLRGRLNYANVVATLALFIALGGSSYAVSQISGSQIRNASIAGKKLKRNTLGGKRIKESRLGTVPSARNARRIGARLLGLPAEDVDHWGHMVHKPAQVGEVTPWHQDEAYWHPGFEHAGISVWMPLQPAVA
jgi:hypothetical protein